MTFRAYMDNVMLRLDPVQKTTKGGIHIPDQAKGYKGYARSRVGTVLRSGRGYFGSVNYQHPRGVFVENETKPGDRVLVPFVAGQNYDMDVSAPRHNKGQEFLDMLGEEGEFRIVREQEILGIFDGDTLRPLGNHVMVRRVDPEKVTPGGIHIPDIAQKDTIEGEVIAVGSGWVSGDGKRYAPEVEVGETALFGRYIGTEWLIDDVPYLLLREDDILGVIERES